MTSLQPRPGLMDRFLLSPFTPTDPGNDAKPYVLPVFTNPPGLDDSTLTSLAVVYFNNCCIIQT
jgi:hypothetical protein